MDFNPPRLRLWFNFRAGFTEIEQIREISQFSSAEL
jgi:hypothetical protein